MPTLLLRIPHSAFRTPNSALRILNRLEPSSPKDLPHRGSGISKVPSHSFTDSHRRSLTAPSLSLRTTCRPRHSPHRRHHAHSPYRPPTRHSPHPPRAIGDIPSPIDRPYCMVQCVVAVGLLDVGGLGDSGVGKAMKLSGLGPGRRSHLNDAGSHCFFPTGGGVMAFRGGLAGGGRFGGI